MQDTEWEDVVVNNNELTDTEWEDAKPVTQSVMDDRDGKIYNVPLAMDGIDTRYAIDTQHKGADKGSFFGKLNLDIDNILELKAKAHDFIYEKTKSALRGVVGIAGDVADTIVTEVSGLRDAQYKAEKGYSRYPSFFFGSDENQEEVKAKAQETVAKLENIKKRNQEWWNNAKQAVKKEEEMDEVDKFVEALSGGAVSVAASATSTLALRSPKVAAGVMATLFGKMRENELIDEALEQGVDIEKAEMIGAGGGLIEAGLEFAGDLFISKFAKLKPIMDAKDRILSSAIVKATKDKIGKAAVKKIATSHADSVIGAFAKGFGSEAMEEGAQTGLGMGYENLVGLSNYSADEIYSNTLASAIIGGITGSAAGGIGTAYNNRTIRQTNERIKKLLKEDAPSLNDQELQVMADGVQEMLFQESTVYIDELNKVLDKEASPEVLKEGLTPEQLTAETRKLLKEKYKMTDEQIDQTIKSSLSVIDARSQFNEAYTIFNEGLSNAGRDAARADAEARILAVRALAVARAEGTQVKDVLDRWNLQFRQTAWNEADIDGASENAKFQFSAEVYKDGKADIESDAFKKWSNDSHVVDIDVFKPDMDLTEKGVTLRLFHGTDKGGFNAFSKSEVGSNTGNAGNGFWGGAYNIAKTYSESTDEFTEENKTDETRSGIYEMYMTLRNPQVWDFQGASWDGIAYDRFAIYNEEEYGWEMDEETGKYLLFDSREEAEAYLEEKGITDYKDGDSIMDRDIETKYSISRNPELFLRTGEIAQEAEENGFDGIIIQNIQDGGRHRYSDEEGTIAVAFDPNQLKSVYNKGSFSLDTDNMFYQTNGSGYEKNIKSHTVQMNNNKYLLTQKEGKPKIADDDVTIAPVEIAKKDVPDLNIGDFATWVMDNIGDDTVHIDATNENIGVSKSNIRRGRKKSKSKEKQAALAKIKELFRVAQYSGFEENDGQEKHENVDGQDVYHTAMLYDGKVYSVQFKVDNLKNREDRKYAGHSIEEIKIAPTAERSGLSSGTLVQADAISKISIAVLRGKVKPVNYDKKNRIYYQGGEDVRDLYATHNMNLVGVRNALKMGGLAMPSLAMRKVSQGNINQFGDIVFVANERLAAPARGIEVYDRDAWTPNLGGIVRYDMNSNANDFIRSVLKRVGQEVRTSTFRYNIEENLMNPRSNDMAIELYHLDKMSTSDEPVNFSRDSQEYLDWYDEHILSNAEPYLWTENASNTDMVRKKFTLDNMMKILRKQEKSGGGFIGNYIFDVFKLLNFRAQKFKNIKEVKKNKHKLVSPEEQRNELSKLNDDFLALAEELKKGSGEYRYGGATYGLGLALIQDSDEKIKYWLDIENLQSDDAAVKKVKDFIERMKDIPTDYFEVKPRRIVDFSEFSGVIIPKGKEYDNVAETLARQHYLTVERVEKGNNEEYDQALHNIQANASTTFFQDKSNPQGPRGAYSNNIIYLFENADASTVIHELGHFFLDDMQKFADNETTKRQLEAIYKFVGSTDGNLTTEQHEYFANAFELYLMEGRAPNKVLEGVFIRFRKWLTRMWSEIKRIGNVKLTPEIRKVFDEMLGGRGLDFAMQMSGAKMAEALESGTIPPNVIAKAVQLLEDGKMSRADMDDLLARMKSGELKRSDFNQELKKFENSNTKHNERLNPFDKVKYREALARGNFSKRDVLEKINRLLKWTEPRSQNGKVVGRFSNLKMNQEFDHIRELMNMEKVQAKEKLDENIKLINAMIRGEETGDMDRLVFDNKILTIRLNKANASLLLDVYNAISDSYNMGRLTTAVTGEARRARKNRLVNEAVHVLTADGDVDWRRERSKLKQFVNQLGTSQMSWQGILDILSMNDKTSKTGRSLLVQNLDVFDAQQKEAQGLAEDGEKASRFMEKKLKGVGNAAISVSRYVNSKLDEKFTIQWGLNKKTFTKDQLLDIYMKAKDEETRKMMLEDPILQYNERFLSEVNEILTAEDRAIAEALFEFYDDNYAKINAFYEEKYGTSLGKRAFYSPRSMDRGGINVDSGDLSSYAGFSGVKERKAKAGAVKIKGAFQVLQDYIVNSNHWIAWSDKLIDINAVMGDVEVKNIIRNLFGEGMEKRIAYEVSRMASNDKFQSKFGYGKLFNKIRSNYAIAALAAKPSLMIKQLTSFPAYWEHMSTAEFMSGLADFAVHMKEAVETLGNTTLMKTRDVNIIKDFEELSKSELFKKNANKVKLRELLMANIKLGDRGAIYMGGWALYKAELKKNLAKGMSEEKAKALALEKFERVTDETQQSGRLSQQSYWQSNPFLRAFTMFQSSQNQYLRKEINAIRGLATGRMDKKQALKTLFIFHVLLPCFFQYASDGFDWDEKAQLRAALLGSLNGIFILNGILERGLDYALGTADAWKATSTALSDVLPFWGSGEDLAKFFIDLAEGDIDLEDYVEAIRAFGKPVGELTGIPVKYPLDVIQNFGSYAEEGEVKKEVLLWLGWSPYALRDKEED